MVNLRLVNPFYEKYSSNNTKYKILSIVEKERSKLLRDIQKRNYIIFSLCCVVMVLSVSLIYASLRTV